MAHRVPSHANALINGRYWRFSLHCQQAFRKYHKENPKEHPYMQKYADKIACVQGHSVENIQNHGEKPAPRSNNQQKFSGFKNSQSHFSNEQANNYSFSGMRQKSLGTIMKLELLKDKSAEEIESIWKQYFGKKDGLFAVVLSATYHEIVSKSKEFPTFLYPVPKEPGYEFVVGQFKENSCYFTSLQDYQVHNDHAPVCLTITYYSELIEEKGIVLMRGEFDNKVLTIQEAQCIANQLQMYYGESSAKKQKLLSIFNREPQKFNYMDVISELEIGLC